MRRSIPAYRCHKASNRAVVTLTDATTGRRADVYLGEYGTPASQAEYDRVIRQWLEGGRAVERPERDARADAAAPAATTTVRDVCLAYLHEVQHLYPDKRSPRRYQVHAALRVAVSLFGKLPAREFGPRALRKVRDTMATKRTKPTKNGKSRPWKRGTVNSRMRIIVAAFKWAASHEMVKPSVWQGLASVPALRKGEQGVADDGNVLPVPLADVDAVKPHVAPQVRALIDLQLLTGARGGELLIMRPVDIDTTGKVWLYRPTTHKGQHRGQSRVIYLGPRAQAIVKPFLQTRDRLDAYLFSPREANAARKAETATKGQPRRENQAPTPTTTTRTIGDHYRPDSYRKAIEYGCKAANRDAIARGDKRAAIDVWTPHQLRHTAATEIRREFGLEAASLVLGHSSAVVTDSVYAERDAGKVSDVMLKIG